MAEDHIDVKETAKPNTDTEPPAEQGEESGASERDARVCVIGIGASAGGLEAVSRLLEKTPVDSGAAFVIVQHLAPTKDSAMPELLGRRTSMPVYQVTDNMKIEPNTVYLIPPDKNMSMIDGALQLLDSIRSSGIRHPIDFFLKSLARDLGRSAVCVIMSGTGTDGTEGARLIKAELGLVIAQDPREARYDGMPRSVIDAGLADLVDTMAAVALAVNPICLPELALGHLRAELDHLRALLACHGRQAGAEGQHGVDMEEREAHRRERNSCRPPGSPVQVLEEVKQ